MENRDMMYNIAQHIDEPQALIYFCQLNHQTQMLCSDYSFWVPIFKKFNLPMQYNENLPWYDFFIKSYHTLKNVEHILQYNFKLPLLRPLDDDYNYLSSLILKYKGYNLTNFKNEIDVYEGIRITHIKNNWFIDIYVPDPYSYESITIRFTMPLSELKQLLYELLITDIIFVENEY